MAHLIEINNGVASFVENGRKERAWHRLGQVFDGQLSVKEALELSHADYQVEARNVFAMTPALQEMELDNLLAEVLLTESNLKVYKQAGINHQDISTVGRNQFFAVKNAMERGIGQEYCEAGTGMWVINGLTTYYQNEKNYSSEELKFNNLMNGTAALKVQKAYDLLAAV